MTQPAVPVRWPLNRILLLVLLAGFLTLMADIRVEHADRFGKFWQAWIPIYYSATMAGACLVGALAWNAGRRGRLIRTIVFYLFLLGFAVGGYGLWLHNAGNFSALIKTLVDAWIIRIHHEDVPPQLAPAAFCGLSLIGLLATARRTQPR